MTADAQVDVEIFADLVCPWCYIGKRHLDRALATLPERAGRRVRLLWRPFQLNPGMPAAGMSRTDYVAAKFGDRAQAINERGTEAARAAGLQVDFNRIVRQPNTRNAHRLVLALQTQRGELPGGLVDDLFRAFFERGQDIGDRTVLADIAVGGGFDRDAALRLLEGDDHGADVDASQYAAQTLGMQGVPTFLMGSVDRVSGAQPPEVLGAVLGHALDA